MITPLITQEANRGLENITAALNTFVNGDAMTSFQYLGMGVGSIMLLFVVIYYIISILDGGKFQVKMLLPILIFVFVCNFTWISKPVTGFTSKITKGLIASTSDAETQIYEDYFGGYSEDKYPRTIMGFFRFAKEQKSSLVAKAIADVGGMNNPGSAIPSLTSPAASTAVGAAAGTDGANGAAAADDAPKPGLSSVSLSELLTNFWNLILSIPGYILGWMASDFAGYKVGTVDCIDFIAILLFWLANILANVLGLMGAVMSALCVLFGPVTFAFALFPGGSSTVKTWFIRLCQFSLYAPIAYMLRSLAVKCYAYSIALPGFEASLVGVAAALVAIICLMSTPSIASMVIEGAQGAVSLSSGLQSFTSAMSAATAVGGMAGGAWRLAAGQNNVVSNAAAGIGQMGVFGFGGSVLQNGLSGAWGTAVSTGQSARGYGMDGQASMATVQSTLEGIRDSMNGGGKS